MIVTAFPSRHKAPKKLTEPEEAMYECGLLRLLQRGASPVPTKVEVATFKLPFFLIGHYPLTKKAFYILTASGWCRSQTIHHRRERDGDRLEMRSRRTDPQLGHSCLETGKDLSNAR